MTTPQGSFVWYELMTSDPSAATAFYTRVLGWSAADSGMPGYTLVSAGPAQVAGIMALPEAARAMGAKPGWVGYIAVPNVDAAAASVAAAGGAIHHAPEDIPGIGRFAAMADPHGASFALFCGMPGEEAPLHLPEDIRDRLEGSVDLVIDAGPCSDVATTIVDLHAEPAVVLRRGGGDPTRLGFD